MDGGAGNDTLDGGTGDDVVIYNNVTGGITLSLALSGPQNTGGAGTDTVLNVEAVTGSFNFADHLSGNSEANVLNGQGGNDTLSGADGNDTLEGGAGEDLIDGGAGIDTARYWFSTVGVTVSLAISGQQNTVGAGIHTLISIEGLEGSFSNDSLTGDGGNNGLIGSNGNDTLAGGLGNDTLDGGIGNDSLDGGAGTSDLAWFSGTKAGYSVVYNGGTSWTVTDTNTGDGNDGVDTLSNLESIRFSDVTEALSPPPPPPPPPPSGAVFSDFDGDGKSDVLWRNTETGGNNYWSGIDHTQVAFLARVLDHNSKVVGLGDFDGDGKSDILWRNTSTGAKHHLSERRPGHDPVRTNREQHGLQGGGSRRLQRRRQGRHPVAQRQDRPERDLPQCHQYHASGDHPCGPQRAGGRGSATSTATAGPISSGATSALARTRSGRAATVQRCRQ